MQQFSNFGIRWRWRCIYKQRNAQPVWVRSWSNESMYSQCSDNKEGTLGLLITYVYFVRCSCNFLSTLRQSWDPLYQFDKKIINASTSLQDELALKHRLFSLSCIFHFLTFLIFPLQIWTLPGFTLHDQIFCISISNDLIRPHDNFILTAFRSFANFNFEPCKTYCLYLFPYERTKSLVSWYLNWILNQKWISDTNLPCAH